MAGCASTLSTDQAGDLIAVRSSGEIYYTVPSALQPPPATVNWNPIGGAAQSVAIRQNYHVYAISNRVDPLTQSFGIWECTAPFQGAQNACPNNSGATGAGSWHQIPGALKGAGTSALVSHFDVNNHTGLTSGVTCATSPCQIDQDGFWLVRSDGELFFYNPSYSASPGWVKFTGLSSVNSIAPLSAAIGGACPCGIFAASGSPATSLQYYDFSNQSAGWTAVPLPSNVASVAGIAINSASAAAGSSLPGVGVPLYLVSATAPVNTAYTGLAQSIPMTVTIAPAALNGNAAPNMGPPNRIYIYVYGKNANGSFVYVNAPNGSTTAWTSSSTPSPLSWSANPTPCPTSAGAAPCSSQTYSLPPLSSGEIYLSSAPITWSGGPGSAPAAWNPSDANNSTYYDFVEYTWASAAAPVYVDTSQVNAMGLSLAFNLVGIGHPNGQQAGFQTGAVNALWGYLQTSIAWNFLANADLNPKGFPFHVLSPVGLNYPGPAPTAAPAGAGGKPAACTAPAPTAGTANPPQFVNGAFLDCAFEAVWLNFLPPNYVVLAAAENMSGGDLYGQVDNNENFQFYIASDFNTQTGSPNPGATPFVTLANPFHNAYGNKETASAALLQQNGFALGTVGYPPPPAPQATAFPGNGNHPTPAAAVGNMVSTAVNRGILTATTPSGTTIGCPPMGQFPWPAPAWPSAENVYAAALWQVASTLSMPPTSPSTYNLPFADQCNQSTTRIENAPTSLHITVNGS